MADDCDAIDERSSSEEVLREKARERSDPYEPPPGTSGNCDLCGEWFGRLIGDACAPCRDKYKLP